MTDPPFHETWCTCTTQMAAIDSLLYNKSLRGPLAPTVDDDDEEMWTPRMEAECRFKGYQHLRGKQLSRRCCKGGFTLGAIVDAVMEMFERDEKAEWVVLESVRERDVYMDRERPGYVLPGDVTGWQEEAMG